MAKPRNAIIPAKYRALVREWLKRCLPARTKLCGVNELGIWYHLPPPSKSTGLVPWPDVKADVQRSQHHQTYTPIGEVVAGRGARPG